MTPKLVVMVVAVSLLVSFAANLYLGSVTEGSVWKKTAIEALSKNADLDVANGSMIGAITKMADELRELNNEEVNAILKKHLR